MCTGLSEITNHNEQSTPLLGAYTYTKLQTQNDISIAVTDDEIHSHTTYHTVSVVTPLTFLLWLC